MASSAERLARWAMGRRSAVVSIESGATLDERVVAVAVPGVMLVRVESLAHPVSKCADAVLAALVALREIEESEVGS